MPGVKPTQIRTVQEGRGHSDAFMIFDKMKPFKVQSLSVVPTSKNKTTKHEKKKEEKQTVKQTPLVAQPNTNQ